MPYHLHRLPLVHPGTNQRVIVVYSIARPNGDGWHEPRDEGGPRFQGAYLADGENMPADIWDWAEEEFANHLGEAAEFAASEEDAQRELMAEARHV